MSAWNEESLVSWLVREELNRGHVLIQLSSREVAQRALREAHEAPADSFQDTEVAQEKDGRCICLTRNSKPSFAEEFRQPVRW